MKKIFCLALLALCALAIPAVAQTSPAAGEWDITMNTPGGPREMRGSFKVEGEKLTGTIGRAGTPGGLPAEGTVKGKTVQFSYTVKYNDNDLKITMTGDIEGDAIKGKVDFGGFAEDEWSAKRASAATAASATAPATGGTPAKVDVSGAWDVEVQTDQGSGNPSFNFKQEGEKLTGDYKGLLGEAKLTGTVKGDQINFSMKVSGQVDGTVTYTGTTDGKTMKGKVSLAGVGEGTFTGKKK